MQTDKKLPFELGERDVIIGVRTDYASGPGWSNAPLWIYVQDGDQHIRQECLQPEEQPELTRRVYAALEALQNAVLRDVKMHLTGRL